MKSNLPALLGILLLPIVIIAAEPQNRSEKDRSERSIFAKDNLVAWCIVPFDAKRRGPTERAEMVRRLGLSKIAYDWRSEHVPTFEEEILAYQNHGVEFFAFWSWHDAIGPLIQKYGIKPQIWQTNPSPKTGGSREEMIEAAAKELLPLVETTRALDLKLGLYNHGGWGGEPENLAAVCEYLRKQHGASHVGIVYNLHHGHGHIDDFAESLARMQPYLLCLNLNGMANASDAERQKILPIGSGKHDRRMLQIVLDSGYSGPIGILDHRPELDAEESLRQNLAGLEQVTR